MAFRNIDHAAFVKFNSAISSDLIQLYKNHVTTKIQKECAKPKSRTFAPSSMRCDRKSWFRLRGTQPDFLDSPDLGMNFRAEIGTARHRVIQQNLQEALGTNWIDVEDYLKSIDFPHKYKVTKSGYESLIEIISPPIKFACDGIIQLNGKLYLLEIKTADYESFSSLSNIKEVHRDQIITYSTILRISNVLVLYEDRQHGEMKCFEMKVSYTDMQNLITRMNYVIDCVNTNLAPNRLSKNDYICKNCEYRKKCKEWG